MMFMRIILALSLAAFTVAVPAGAAGVGSVLQRGQCVLLEPIFTMPD